MGQRDEQWVSSLLSQVEELLPYLTRRPVFPAGAIKGQKQPQHREELRRLPHPSGRSWLA